MEAIHLSDFKVPVVVYLISGPLGVGKSTVSKTGLPCGSPYLC